MSRPPDFLNNLPAPYREQMIEACEGDWSRLVYDPKDGSITCWNAAQPPDKSKMRRVDLPPSGATAKALRATATKTTAKKTTARKTAAKNAAPETKPTPPKLAPVTELPKAEPTVNSGGKPESRPRTKKTAAFREPTPPPSPSHIEPPVAAAHDLSPAVPASPVPQQRRQPDPGDVLIDPWVPDDEIEGDWVPGAGTYDDEGEATVNAFKLATDMKDGVPPRYRIRIQRKVLEMIDLQTEDILPAIRRPQYVTVDRYTKEAHYPVLRFRRGDLTVVVSFRQRIVTVLGMYWASLEHGSNAPGGAGGGGARKQAGVPKSRMQLIKALRELGAEFDEEQERPMVRFGGRELGQVTLIEHRPRLDWERDWQRIQRKVSAIRRGAETN